MEKSKEPKMAISKTSFKKGHKRIGGASIKKMAKMKQRNKEKFLAALEQSLGIISDAANICGLSRNTHYGWMKEDPEYKKRVEDISEMALDYVESKLLELIKSGKEASTIFYMKTKGKKRGYIEQPGYEIPPDEGVFKMPKIEIVKDISYEDVTPKRIENE